MSAKTQPTPGRQRAGRATFAALAALLALATAGGTALAQGSSSPGQPGSDQPVSSSPAPGVPAGPADDGATIAHPDPNVTNLVRQPWDHVTVAADGRTLSIYYWGGVPECYGLGHVDVTQDGGHVDIALWTGTQPTLNVCIELAMLYRVDVTLDTPLITGGSI